MAFEFNAVDVKKGDVVRFTFPDGFTCSFPATALQLALQEYIKSATEAQDNTL